MSEAGEKIGAAIARHRLSVESARETATVLAEERERRAQEAAEAFTARAAAASNNPTDNEAA